MNTDSVFLKPGVVKNYNPDEEESKEESRQEIVEEDEATVTREQKLWLELGDLMSRDKTAVQSMRKDTLEGLELSNEAKKAQQERQRKNSEDFECKEEGFSFATSQITVMEAPKKKKRRR